MKKREGKWELAQDLLQSTSVRKEIETPKPKPPEPTIMQTVYQVVSSMKLGK